MPSELVRTPQEATREGLMLDPSLLLSERTLPVVEAAWASGELAGAVLPASFVRAFSGTTSRKAVVRYFRGTREAEEFEPGTAPNIRRPARLLGEMSESEAVYHGPRLADEAFARSLNVVTKDSVVSDVPVEEWLFLTSSSIIASRIKRPFSAFVRAGAVTLEWGRHKFDLAAARVLRLPPERLPKPLSPGQRIRAVSKWIAVGGTSVTSLYNPIAGAIGTLVSGMFLLFD